MRTHEENTLRLLFIGNSHTYVNEVPHSVQQMAREERFICSVTMLAHGGWTLRQHVSDPEARFNILYGEYEYVILQEHSHPFAPEDEYRSAVKDLCGWIRDAGSKPILYATWAKKNEPEKQAEMNRIQREAAEECGALLAPVGAHWQSHIQSQPNIDLYGPDGAHASPAGSALAARIIWATIRDDVTAHTQQIKETNA